MLKTPRGVFCYDDDMPKIDSHVANATGELDSFLSLIESAVSKVLPIVEKELNAIEIDIFFLSASMLAIPEYGIGGNSPGPNHTYITFDPDSNKITEDGLIETLLHEIHHCMRWRDPGYGNSLGEAMISEGLACLYEEMHKGSAPIYATVDISTEQIAEAKSVISRDTHDHNRWFYGSEDITRWFGYTYGYQLCKRYAEQTNTNAAEMLNIDPSLILANA
jgi:uncharacterized protein YjaZ